MDLAQRRMKMERETVRALMPIKMIALKALLNLQWLEPLNQNPLAYTESGSTRKSSKRSDMSLERQTET